MEVTWIKRDSNPHLIIFVLGWAVDHRVVDHLSPEGYDVAAIYDYRDMTAPDLSDFELYDKRYLFAWSFGVWVAEQMLGNIGFDKTVALNGTPYPMDARYGLEPRRAAITLRGIEKGGTEQFSRRAYGEFYDRLKDVVTPRTKEANIEELSCLMELSSVAYTPEIAWDKAVVGSGDVIFPAQNMISYWGERAEVLPLPHYPFGDPALITDTIDNR